MSASASSEIAWTIRLSDFFLDAVSMNVEKWCNHYRLIVPCMLSGASQGRPVIVGWSIAPCGQGIEENLGQLLKKLTAGPRVCQGPNHHAPNWGRNRMDHRT